MHDKNNQKTLRNLLRKIIVLPCNYLALPLFTICVVLMYNTHVTINYTVKLNLNSNNSKT